MYGQKIMHRLFRFLLVSCGFWGLTTIYSCNFSPDETDPVVCGNYVCPKGYLCNEATSQCVDPTDQGGDSILGDGDLISCETAEDCQHIPLCARYCNYSGFCQWSVNNDYCRTSNPCITDSYCPHESADLTILENSLINQIENGCIQVSTDCSDQITDLETCQVAYCDEIEGCKARLDFEDQECLSCQKDQDCQDKSGVTCIQGTCKSGTCSFEENVELCQYTASDPCVTSASCTKEQGCQIDILDCPVDGNECTVDECIMGQGCPTIEQKPIPEDKEGECCSNNSHCPLNEAEQECMTAICVIDTSEECYHHCNYAQDATLCGTDAPENPCRIWECNYDSGCVEAPIVLSEDGTNDDGTCCAPGDVSTCRDTLGECIKTVGCCNEANAACNSNGSGLFNCQYEVRDSACNDNNNCSNDTCIVCDQQYAVNGIDESLCANISEASFCQNEPFSAISDTPTDCCYYDGISLAPTPSCKDNLYSQCNREDFSCIDPCLTHDAKSCPFGINQEPLTICVSMNTTCGECDNCDDGYCCPDGSCTLNPNACGSKTCNPPGCNGGVCCPDGTCALNWDDCPGGSVNADDLCEQAGLSCGVSYECCVEGGQASCVEMGQCSGVGPCAMSCDSTGGSGDATICCATGSPDYPYPDCAEQQHCLTLEPECGGYCYPGEVCCAVDADGTKGCSVASACYQECGSSMCGGENLCCRKLTGDLDTNELICAEIPGTECYDCRAGALSSTGITTEPLDNLTLAPCPDGYSCCADGSCRPECYEPHECHFCTSDQSCCYPAGLESYSNPQCFDNPEDQCGLPCGFLQTCDLGSYCIYDSSTDLEPICVPIN